MPLTASKILEIDEKIRVAISEDRNEDALALIIFCFTGDDGNMFVAEEAIQEYFNRFRRECGRSEFDEEDFSLSYQVMEQRGYTKKQD